MPKPKSQTVAAVSDDTVVDDTPEVETKPGVPEHTGEVVYDSVELYKRWAEEVGGDGPITVDEAKDMLGWYPEPVPGAFKDDYDLEDFHPQGRKKVRLVNNINNREHDKLFSETYAYEILNRNWAGPTILQNGDNPTVNGESLVLSRTAKIKSGQHRLVGLVLAAQLWEREKATWQDKWDQEPYLETVLVVGISDDPNVTRTFDCVRARTGADTLQSSGVFDEEGIGRGDRKHLCKIADNAIKRLWDLTDAKSDNTNPFRTQTAISTFLETHPRLKDAVKWVYENNQTVEGAPRLARFGSPGYTAAHLYLMGMSATDYDKYKEGRTEEHADDGNWDAALSLWHGLASGASEYRPVWEETKFPRVGDGKGVKGYSGQVFAHGKNSQPAPPAIRYSNLCKVWNVYLAGGVDGFVSTEKNEKGKEVSKVNIQLDFTGIGRDSDGLVNDDLWTDFEVCHIGGMEAPERKGKDDHDDDDDDTTTKPATEGLKQIVKRVVDENEGAVLLFKSPAGATTPSTLYKVWGDQATLVHEVTGIGFAATPTADMACVEFPAADMMDVLPKLFAKGCRVVEVIKRNPPGTTPEFETEEKKGRVTKKAEVTPIVKPAGKKVAAVPAPAPAPTGKKKVAAKK
jgi:hypothetical protein